ncbi:hypothetical protein VKT23_018013 [Stygiomarasmius scandens]|uniref:Transposase n=1 Tax=Marasmiellus scandens TaxID=2682957 RepID=A0ABR1IUG4_9AGAR
MPTHYHPDPNIFERDGDMYICLVCKDGKRRAARHLAQHLQTNRHINNATPLSGFHSSQSVFTSSSSFPEAERARRASFGPLMRTLAQLGEPHNVAYRVQPEQNLEPMTGVDSGLNNTNLTPECEDGFSDFLLDQPPEAHLCAMAQSFQEYLENGMPPDYASDDDSQCTVPDQDDILVSDANPGLAYGEYRRRNQEVDPLWFPWPDKIHLPRSTFSDIQLETISWALRVNGVNHVPSLDSQKHARRMLDAICGISTIRYSGALGHIYYVNSLAEIISREMSNPRVREKLSFYPQNAQGKVDSAKNALRWLQELDPELTTPMIRVQNQDFYLFEPCRLTDGRYCIPYRWVEHVVDGKSQLMGYVWELAPVGDSWIVHSYNHYAAESWRFATSFPNLQHTYITRSIPDPRNIIGIICNRGGAVEQWTYSNPGQENPWRTKAKGRRVYAFPIWLYCDDTSGNKSKKWNKHNSFLFTAAGLDRHDVHSEYHVHFLATSNIAPPLEMLDGIADQIEEGQTTGIWAYDCVHCEMVLLIVSVLAMLGDNPMQSEFACHIGLMGRMFCRCCFVKGKEQQNAEAQSETESVSSAGSQGSQRARQETFLELMDRATRFFETHNLRTKRRTMDDLKTVFTYSKTVGRKTKAKELKTALGIKDTYQDHFAELIFKALKGTKGPAHEKQRKVDSLLEGFPDNISSPIWRIRDLDPHCDTPVEILHVILLGFVKYFWRDAIGRVNDDQKATLTTRLSSLNVDGLDLSSLAGTTLVKYAGSLVGRDFRIVAQAAPFVLYDLVPPECFAAWLALSQLIPLVWQPVIEDMESYLQQLQVAIDNFLNCTARWTPRWFNKPKFHILLHLPEHIRRFGPSILFATETFESFNAIIRGFSIHSNRQAPSRDIAFEFAGLNRVRHLLSGGWFLDPEKLIPRHLQHIQDAPKKEDFCTIGPLPRQLIDNDMYLRKMTGIIPKVANTSGCYVHFQPKTLALMWAETEMSKFVYDADYSRHAWKKCTSFHLSGTTCRLDSVVVIRTPTGRKALAKVLELLQATDDSQSIEEGIPSLILIQTIAITHVSPIYHMPRLNFLPHYSAVRYQDLYCTVNTQHHCHGNGCRISTVTQTKTQEQNKITVSAETVVHQNILDVVLNTAQMRDFAHIFPFTAFAVPPSRHECIHVGARREVETPRNDKNPRKKSLVQQLLRGQMRSRGVAIQRESPLRTEITESN